MWLLTTRSRVRAPDDPPLNINQEETMLEQKNNNVAATFFAPSLNSVAVSIAVWVSADGDPAHAERFGIFVGLWAPTLMGLANYFRE